jgi:hypothetical protein
MILLVGVIAGPLYDMGLFRTLVISGSALIVLGWMFTSLCTKYWQVMLSQGVLIGMGATAQVLLQEAGDRHWYRHLG